LIIEGIGDYMKKTIKLMPLEGILIQNSLQIRLGMSDKELYNIIGKPDNKYEQEIFYDKYDIRIDFDSFNKVEYIEILSNEMINVEIYNTDPLEIYADQLVELLKEKNGVDVSVESNGIGYVFNDISVRVWRELTPDDMNEVIIESKRDGVYEEMKDEIMSDLEKSKKFTTIGIGKKGY